MVNSGYAERKRNVRLFREYHKKYPAYGYHRLNAKICEDTGIIISDVYAHKCSQLAGIKAVGWDRTELRIENLGLTFGDRYILGSFLLRRLR